MKLRSITATIAVSAITIASTVLSSSSAKAQGSTHFVCGESNGVPATLAQTADGNVPVILWASDYFKDSGFDAQTRCRLVSQRFQFYYNTGALNYLTTGRINGQNVVCVARSNDGGCATDLPEQGLLFTLKQGTNPGATLKKLMQVRHQASGPLNESTARVYIDMNEFLRTTPVEVTTSSSPPLQPSVSKPASQSGGSVW